MSEVASKADAILAPVWDAEGNANRKMLADAAAQIAALVPRDDSDREAIAEAQEFLGMHIAAH